MGVGSSIIGVANSFRVAGGPLMERDYRGWCESLVALGDVEVVNLDDREGRPLVVEVCLVGRPVCGGCGGGVWMKDKRRVELVNAADVLGAADASGVVETPVAVSGF